ncbi:alpha,alpha-trehalase nth1 [Vermiconidia calcicola]|uniref:Alpha,alpha-trehalase nth1 n=1 Tax=Vermiconidia calcicola TaxID=1690605 RepID=A0ACC3NTB6_9PEZI|nr:alpha,alpha-trehalase nth1 [Vermiconidia calcicola]
MCNVLKKVSRETARIVSALSPTKRRSTRQAARELNAGDEEGDSGEDEKGALTLRSTSVDGDKKTTSRTPVRKRKREEVSNDEETSVRRSPAKADSTSRKPRRQPAKHIKGPNGSVKTEPPRNWEQVYDATAAMRKRVLAPVDTMGCESLAETHRSPQDQRLQTLVSLMLSSQTKDTVTAVAMRNLQENLPGGFCLDSLLKVDPDVLHKLIEKVGFHNNKTKFIKSVATILSDQYAGDIPDTIEGLISLPGVGPKMAYLCMSAAWGRDEGIGVDVHVHRITNLWGWHKTSTPEQTREMLESWLPREKWHDINHLLVGFGQTICLPVGRKCNQCDLAAEMLCPSAEVRKASPVKKKVKKEVEIKFEDGAVEKADEVVVQADDVGVKVEADLKGDGKIEVQAMAGAVTPDIEDAPS